jgi:acetyltransferase
VAPRAADEHARMLQEAGVPCFPWPERTARAAGVAVRCGLRAATPPPATPTRRTPPRPPVSAGPGRPVSAGPGLVPPDAARELLTAAGIPLAETVVCDSAAAAVAAADRLGYPAVAKVAHPAVTHKTDAGGVRLGLLSSDAVRSAARDLLALADGAAVLVQRQREGIELVIGGVRDPEFGPVVMAGFGGILVEAVRDVQLAVAPLDEVQANALLRSLRGAAVLAGLRGRPPTDLGPVAAVIVAVGDLMAGHPEISELDLNPVLVGAGPPVAVDWRIRIG